MLTIFSVIFVRSSGIYSINPFTQSIGFGPFVAAVDTIKNEFTEIYIFWFILHVLGPVPFELDA